MSSAEKFTHMVLTLNMAVPIAATQFMAASNNLLGQDNWSVEMTA